MMKTFSRDRAATHIARQFAPLLMLSVIDCVSPLRNEPALLGAGQTLLAAGRASDLLTAAQIAAEPGLVEGYALDAVRRLRPRFIELQSLDGVKGTGQSPTVLVDGTLRGGLEVLRSIPAGDVVTIRFLRPIDAMQQRGPIYSSGLILVTTR
jgi:hypothetical protein